SADHLQPAPHTPPHPPPVPPRPGPRDSPPGPGLWGAAAPLPGQTRRCGNGPRLPFLVISPWANHNYVDHTLTDFSSIDKFIEDNWGLPRIPGSFDTMAGSIDGLFNFKSHHPHNSTLYLNPTTRQPLRKQD